MGFCAACGASNPNWQEECLNCGVSLDEKTQKEIARSKIPGMGGAPGGAPGGVPGGPAAAASEPVEETVAAEPVAAGNYPRPKCPLPVAH